MATLRIQIDDSLKQRADILFKSLGLDTITAIHIFLKAALENGGIPFPVSHRLPLDNPPSPSIGDTSILLRDSGSNV